MTANRTGAFGVLSTTGAIPFRNAAGKVDEAVPGGVSPVAGLGYPLHYGANFQNAAQQGNYCRANGEGDSNNNNSLTPITQQAAPKDGTITRFAWDSETADATTVFKVLVNGLVVETITLTGVAGALANLSSPVVAGDTISVEYDDDTAPRDFNCTVFIE